MAELLSRSALLLQTMGELLGSLLKGGDVLVLSGGLGAGKTTFTQGIARGMSIKTPVTSPTFSLIHVYEGPQFNLVHCDFYRLKSVQEVENIGFLDYLTRSNAVVVEWGEEYLELMPKDSIHISIEQVPEGRLLKISSKDSAIEQWVKQCQSLA